MPTSESNLKVMEVDSENINHAHKLSNNILPPENNESVHPTIKMESENHSKPTTNQKDEEAPTTNEDESTTNTIEEKHLSTPEQQQNDDGYLELYARQVARNPCTHLLVALAIALTLSIIAMTVGDFAVNSETGGWQSRGTLLANRQTQQMLTLTNSFNMLLGGDEAWDDLIKNVQPGWQVYPDTEDDTSNRRQLLQTYQNHDKHNLLHRHLQNAQLNISSSSGIVDGCDVNFYNPSVLVSETRLWPVWKTKSSSDTILNPEVILDICLAEETTQRILEEEKLCIPCGDTGRCLPPFSVVFYARLVVENGMSMSCQELSEAWVPFQEPTTQQWKTCVTDLRKTYNPEQLSSLPPSCPPGFWPSLVDDSFDETSLSRFTSSIFATRTTDADAMYDIVDRFDRSDNDNVNGAYDTQAEDFVTSHVGESISNDMALAMASGLVVTLAMVVHTRSLFLSLIGLVQIILSFPLAYFVYKLLIGLDFFPFLNFIGLFVVFALGAGDVFVAVDKWKNTREQNPSSSVEDVAAIALPDAASAMFLTTLTTAIAFFATCICPIAPIMLFAVFCGLLIVFDYLMNVFLVFPALCIYDNAITASDGHENVHWSISFSFSFDGLMTRLGFVNDGDDEKSRNNTKKNNDSDEEEGEGVKKDDDESEPSSFVKRMLLTYYEYLHKTRWTLLGLCVVALTLSVYFATTLALPTSSDIRLLSEDIQFEQSYVYRQNLLSTALDKTSGSRAFVIWGVQPADTGDLNDPASWSQLVLDKSFNPSTEQAQLYITDFCESIFGEEFADTVSTNFTCPMTKFGSWLEEQSLLTSDEQDTIYQNSCNGADSLPMSQDTFDSCIIPWAKSNREVSILSYQGKVQIIFFPFVSRVRFDSSYADLDNEWNLIEDWVQDKLKFAPEGVEKGYFTSFDFWWYDTNGQMISAASGAAGVALACAAAVILFSSRSLVITFFSTLTIVYALASVTSMLVAMGWTLGFLEAICFAILIGVSVDFVIHLSHAYTIPPGNTDRGERAKFAIISMGPSILVTAATTILSSFVMLFAVVVFFQKFALILFFTVIQATAGSFVFLMVMLDCVGPSNPTYLFDKLMERVKKSENRSNNEEEVKEKHDEESTINKC